MSEENEVINNQEDSLEINSLKQEIENQKAELDEREDRLKRLMAEFDNFKKRSAKEREQLYNSLISDIAISFLPVIDKSNKNVTYHAKCRKEKVNNVN